MLMTLWKHSSIQFVTKQWLALFKTRLISLLSKNIVSNACMLPKTGVTFMRLKLEEFRCQQLLWTCLIPLLSNQICPLMHQYLQMKQASYNWTKIKNRFLRVRFKLNRDLLKSTEREVRKCQVDRKRQAIFWGALSHRLILIRELSKWQITKNSIHGNQTCVCLREVIQDSIRPHVSPRLSLKQSPMKRRQKAQRVLPTIHSML